MTTYTWVKGARIEAEIAARLAGETIEQLRVKNNGHLTPARLVDESRPEDAPLHPVFEWNDSLAAEMWREDQARYVIRCVAVVYEEAPNQDPQRAFVSVDKEKEPVYTSTAVALSDAEMREQVLRKALSELASWRRRYAELNELAKVFTVADRLIKKAG